MSVWISLHGDMSHEDNKSPEGFDILHNPSLADIRTMYCNVTTPPFLPGVAHERISVLRSWISQSTLGKVRTVFTAGNSFSTVRTAS